MKTIRAFIQRIGSLFNRRQGDRELTDELNSLLQMHIEENIALGMESGEAHRRALIRLGGLSSIQEQYRDRRGIPLLETAVQDIRYGLRTLRKNPGFTSVAVLALALGIGANSAIFSVVYGVLLRPLPYPDSGRVAMVYAHFSPQDVEHGTMSIADYLDLKASNTAFEDPALTSYSGWHADIRSPGQPPESVPVARVTPNFFTALRATPMLGRLMRSDEDSPASGQVAILSERLWRRRFSANTNVIGQQVNIEGRQCTVIGVMPDWFRFWPNTELWMNLQISPPNRRGPYPFIGLGRLKPGVTFEQAQAETNAIAQRIEQQHPNSYSHLSFPVVPLHEAVVGRVRPALLVMSGAVFLVLLIAVVNVANLLLARASTREREMAVRIAMGAGRGRIVRQLLTESVLLALAGGTAGLALARGGIALLRWWNPGNLPRADEIRLDGHVLLFTFLVSLATGVVFGLVPALQSSKTELNFAMKEGGRSGAAGSVGRRRTRSLLVVTEIALSLILLVGAGLLLRSFILLQQVKTGVQAPLTNVLTMQVAVNQSDYPDDAKGVAFYNQLLDHVRNLPGVEGVAISTSLPPDNQWDSDTFQVEGQPWTQAEFPSATCPIVTGDFFRTLGVPLIEGRSFSERDKPNSPPVVIISQTLAKQYFGGQSPIGRHFKQSGTDLENPWEEIVGVVGDVKYTGLDGAPEPAYYQSAEQNFSNRTYMVVHTATPASAMASTLPKELRDFDPDLVVSRVGTMEKSVSESVAQPRFRTSLLALFAAVALVLAAIGIYGVISYSVAQRTSEIGIRMALGAERGDVLRIVIGQGLRLVMAGVTIGAVGALALTRLLSGLLFGINPTDPFTFGVVAGLLTGIGIVACYVPARRAMSINPIEALRYE
jgi:predicted permease